MELDDLEFLEAKRQKKNLPPEMMYREKEVVTLVIRGYAKRLQSGDIDDVSHQILLLEFYLCLFSFDGLELLVIGDLVPGDQAEKRCRGRRCQRFRSYQARASQRASDPALSHRARQSGKHLYQHGPDSARDESVQIH